MASASHLPAGSAADAQAPRCGILPSAAPFSCSAHTDTSQSVSQHSDAEGRGGEAYTVLAVEGFTSESRVSQQHSQAWLRVGGRQQQRQRCHSILS